MIQCRVNRKKLEKFGVFINRSLIRFECEKSPIHTIVYGDWYR